MNEYVWDGSILVWLAARFAVGNSATNYMCRIPVFVYIYIYGPRRFGEWDNGTLQKCFSYGFWWGMDINSRYYLISLIVATLPGMFFSVWYDVGQTVRLLCFSLYLLILYIAFIGKMLFFYHFHDIYNRNIWLGKNADKKNLLDIFSIKIMVY